jgi:hypothetical protein
MKENKEEKEFDAVKMMREIRKKISEDIQSMSFDEIRAYIDAQLAKKKRLLGQNKP